MIASTRKITETGVQNLLLRIVGRWLETNAEASHVQTFEEAGILDRHAKGLVVRIGENEFQISVKRSR